jgi:hypothetical protein
LNAILNPIQGSVKKKQPDRLKKINDYIYNKISIV